VFTQIVKVMIFFIFLLQARINIQFIYFYYTYCKSRCANRRIILLLLNTYYYNIILSARESPLYIISTCADVNRHNKCKSFLFLYIQFIAQDQLARLRSTNCGLFIYYYIFIRYVRVVGPKGPYYILLSSSCVQP